MAHESFDVLKSKLDDVASGLAIGSLWRHFRNGHTYCIDCLPIHEATDEPEIVIYHDVDHPDVPFDTPISRFTETVEVDGARVRRFEKIN